MPRTDFSLSHSTARGADPAPLPLPKNMELELRKSVPRAVASVSYKKKDEEMGKKYVTSWEGKDEQ